jgi:hypothetical protein
MFTLHDRTERLYYRTSELETLGGFCGPDLDNPDGLCFATHHSKHSPCTQNKCRAKAGGGDRPQLNTDGGTLHVGSFRKVLYFLHSLSQGSAWSLLHIHVVRAVIGRCIILLTYV